MRFLLDMGISPVTLEFLSENGHDAVHLIDRGLGKLSDPEILKLARREERALITHDLDFTDLLAASRSKLPSVVLFRLRNMHPDHVNRRLKAVLATHKTKIDSGSILTVSESKIRWRSLPLL